MLYCKILYSNDTSTAAYTDAIYNKILYSKDISSATYTDAI